MYMGDGSVVEFNPSDPIKKPHGMACIYNPSTLTAKWELITRNSLAAHGLANMENAKQKQ